MEVYGSVDIIRIYSQLRNWYFQWHRTKLSINFVYLCTGRVDREMGVFVIILYCCDILHFFCSPPLLLPTNTHLFRLPLSPPFSRCLPVSNVGDGVAGDLDLTCNHLTHHSGQ